MEILGNEPPERDRSPWPRTLPRIPLWLKVLAVVMVLLGTTWMTITDPALDAPRPYALQTALPTPSPTPTPTGRPRLLRGGESGAPTGLRLLIGDTLYDVDARTGRTVRGLPPRRTYSYSMAIGEDAVIVTNTGGDAFEDIRVYVLRRGSDQVRLLATGGFPAPAADGLWLKHWYSEEDCRLRKLSLTGKVMQAPRRIDCGIDVYAESARGLVGWREDPTGSGSGYVVLRPADFGVRQRSDGQVLVVGQALFTVEADTLYADDPGEARRLVGKLPVDPSDIPPQVKGSADGTRLGFQFDHVPAPEDYQSVDFWVYERNSGRWLRMPSMPVSAQIKAFDWAWTEDGRIVAVGEFEGVGVRLVVWRPGERQIEVRRLGPPTEGSGGLVPLVADAGTP